MRQPSPEIVRMAGMILEHEASAASGDGDSDSHDRVHAKLGRELERLIGPGGWAAVLRRARVLAARQYSFGHPDFDQAVLSHLIGIVVDLIGEDLGLRQIQQLWPGMLHRGLPDDSTESQA